AGAGPGHAGPPRGAGAAPGQPGAGGGAVPGAGGPGPDLAGGAGRAAGRSTPGPVNRLRRTVRTLVARYRGRGEPPGWRTAKTTLAAGLCYLLAAWLLGDPVPPLVAPLPALLVAPPTLFETVKSGVERVGSVVAGVLVAVAVSNFVGLTWWSLGIVIFASLVIGRGRGRGGPHPRAPS